MSKSPQYNIPLLEALLADFIHRFANLWLEAGNLETKLLGDRLTQVTIDRPVYITGLARSGTTILLEILSQAQGVATHQYRDFPAIFTPYVWRQAQAILPKKNRLPKQRMQGDRIMITPDSPEAMEEALWMAFFPVLHQGRESEVLDTVTANERFEIFYRNHIRKLLLRDGARRYLAKSNYSMTRLEYLLKLFPDARFIVPIRHPVAHVASLVRQHRKFMQVIKDNPRAKKHLQQVGHFEFGPDRAAIHTGSKQAFNAVQQLWLEDEVLGWAKYWAMVYRYLAERLESSPELNKAVFIVEYEKLCQNPQQQIKQVLEHASLHLPKDKLVQWEGKIKAPSYYNVGFSLVEQEKISHATFDVAKSFGIAV